MSVSFRKGNKGRRGGMLIDLSPDQKALGRGAAKAQRQNQLK